MEVLDLLTLTRDRLQAQFGAGVLGAEQHYDFPVIYLTPDVAHDALQFLRDEPDLSYHFLTTLCGSHYPDRVGQEFEVVYHLHNMPENRRIRVKVLMAGPDPVTDSVTDLWPAANWQERETWDFYGIVFTGHPDLRRILNMDEMNYHPLRKEFPLEDGSRDDKDNEKFGR